jgi:hypothetical protein
MSWAVEIIIDGGQRDGRIAHHVLVDDLVGLQARLADTKEHVYEIHAYQTANNDEDLARMVVEQKRRRP